MNISIYSIPHICPKCHEPFHTGPSNHPAHRATRLVALQRSFPDFEPGVAGPE